jgi:hypothetical protein
MKNGRAVPNGIHAMYNEVIFASYNSLPATSRQDPAHQHKTNVSRQGMKGLYPLPSCEDHQ